MRAGLIAKLLGTAVALAAIPAQAAVVTIVQIVDLSTLDLSSGGSGVGGSLTGGSYNVFDGDTLDFTLKFVGTQSLKITNLQYLYALPFNPGGIGGHTGASAIQFLDFSGPGVASFNMNYNSCCHHLGPIIGPQQFNSGPGTIEFSGIHTSTVVSGFGGTTLSTFGFNFQGSQLGQGTAGTGGGGGNAVPEPATLALLGGGLLGIAGMRRKRALRAA